MRKLFIVFGAMFKFFTQNLLYRWTTISKKDMMEL